MQLEDYIFENNLQADVIFTGFVSQEELRDIYHGSDVALFPIKTQGGWLSIFDAMACGLPVYVSEEATCSSILTREKVGYVCEKDEDFVKFISYTLKQINSEWVKENLSWDKFCKKMEEVYENCIN